MPDNKKEKAKFIKIILLVVVLAIGIAAIFVEDNVLVPKYQERRNEINAVSSIAANIISVQGQTDNYQEILNNSGRVYGTLALDKDKHVSKLGEITLANNLNINKMTVGDIVEGENNISSMTIKLEVQGSLYNIKNFIQQMYDVGSVSRIRSFSYRLQSDRALLWMWRDIDNQSLVDWWDLAGNDLEVLDVNINDVDILDADELLSQGTSLCYLEIEFLGLH